MQIARTRLLCILTGFAIATPLMFAPPLKAQDDCKVIYKMLADAQAKLHSTSAHVYTTSKIGSQTFTSEMIYAGGSMYMKINGKWSLAGSMKDTEASEKPLQQHAGAKDTCRHVKDELLGGNMTTVYATHSETPKGTLDMQVWISKAQGLLLRSDMNSDGGKDLISIRYEYGNIRPPI
jgi:outer membrane lipoprotein-sorting protein